MPRGEKKHVTRARLGNLQGAEGFTAAIFRRVSRNHHKKLPTPSTVVLPWQLKKGKNGSKHCAEKRIEHKKREIRSRTRKTPATLSTELRAHQYHKPLRTGKEVTEVKKSSRKTPRRAGKGKPSLSRKTEPAPGPT